MIATLGSQKRSPKEVSATADPARLEACSTDLLATERELYARGIQLVAGVDEAGRGPLAGPVCAAAVILPAGLSISGVKDSKQLTARQREAVYPKILAHAIAVAVGLATAEEIDELNILQATKLAARRALEALTVTPEFVLLDAFTLDDLPFAQRGIVRGDAQCHAIAAASIVAKVTRDRLMRFYAREFPQYEFDKHKGYPTKRHYERIAQLGLSSIHRRSFFNLGLFEQHTQRSQTYHRFAAQIEAAQDAEHLLRLHVDVNEVADYLPRCEMLTLFQLIRERSASCSGT